jgi:hypothetical protein
MGERMSESSPPGATDILQLHEETRLLPINMSILL